MDENPIGGWLERAADSLSRRAFGVGAAAALAALAGAMAADAKKISRPDMDPKAQMSPSSRMSNNYTYAVTWNRRFSEGAKAVVGERKLG